MNQRGEAMRIGVYQFPGSCDVEKNCKAILKAAQQASKQGVRLLVFQECAVCGYPPDETPDIEAIDYTLLDRAMDRIAQAAGQYGMYLAVGTIRKEGEARYNSIRMIGPDGNVIGHYDKRALWGWDANNYKRGENQGIFIIDGIRVGFRICYDIRFPEYFRELFAAQAPLCFVSFCDVSAEDIPERYEMIKSHLITRAVENVMTVVSVNSISRYQTAPTAVFDPNGRVKAEAPRNEECLLVYDWHPPEITFGMRGRIENSNRLINRHMPD